MAVDACRPLLASGHALIVCDFDGTISRLVPDPWAARIVPGAQRALRRLANAPGVGVVFLSGRTVADLASRARVGNATYLGDHGAEWAAAVRGFRPAALRVQREAALPQEERLVERLADEVPARVPMAWLTVERKGASVAFHFRAAPDVAAARVLVGAAVDDIDPDHLLARHGGKRVIELRPVGASSKADAMAALIDERRPRAIIALGDDRNDALGFDVVRAARASGRLDSVAVAVAGHPDVTPAVALRADVTLDSPAQAARFLRGLSIGVPASPRPRSRRTLR